MLEWRSFLDLGDSLRDLEFNSSDLVGVFASGKYESGAMATWSATMPPASAARIAGWLYAHRLVREA